MEGFSARGDSIGLRKVLAQPWTARLRRLLRNRIVLFGLGPAILIVIGVVYFILNAGVVATDDATVSSARIAITSEVRGRIVSVEVHDNQRVRAGDVLVRLDSGDYQDAVADAQARVAAARLQVAGFRAQYRQAEAELNAARATSAFAERELRRQRQLFHAGVSSQRDVDQAAEQAQVAARQSIASMQAERAALTGLGGSLRAPVDQNPLVLQALAALRRAQRELGDAVIVAPHDGVTAHVDQVQIGSYAQPAQVLFWLISGDPWVDAAFKENQLKQLRPNQPVLIRIDAYPDHEFRGHIASMSPGTGSTFSVLPTQNATGNWVKVVQRLSVRIAFDERPSDPILLAAGLSANVRVDTTRSAAAPLRGREP